MDNSQSSPRQPSSAFTIENLLRDLRFSNPTPEAPPAPVIFPNSPNHTSRSSSSSSSGISTNSLSPSSPWFELHSPSGILTPFPLPFVPFPFHYYNPLPFPATPGLGYPTYNLDSQPVLGTMANNSVNNGAPLINSWAPTYLGQTSEVGGFKNRRNQGTLFRKPCNCSNTIEVIDISGDDVEPLPEFGTHKGPSTGVKGNLNQFALPMSPESAVMDVDFTTEADSMGYEDVEVTLIDCTCMTSDGSPQVVPNGTEAVKDMMKCMTLEEDPGNSKEPVKRRLNVARRGRRRSRMDPEMPKLVAEADYRLRLRSSRMPSLEPEINAMDEPDK